MTTLLRPRSARNVVADPPTPPPYGAFRSPANRKLVQVNELLRQATAILGEWLEQHGRECRCPYCARPAKRRGLNKRFTRKSLKTVKSAAAVAQNIVKDFLATPARGKGADANG